MAIALALLAAASYGSADFIGGIASKTRSAWAVAAASCAVATLGLVVVALVAGGEVRAVDLGWGAAAGVGEGVGLSFLYRGLSEGRMGVVAPISGVGSALIPFGVGVLLAGDSLSILALLGVAVAMPALYLVPQSEEGDAAEASSGSGAGSKGALDGAIAGLGFGAEFACIGQIDESASLLPLALLMLAAGLTIVVIASALRQPLRLRLAEAQPALACGVLNMSAVACFLLATRGGLLAVVSVITALFPALTIALAAGVLREKIVREQGVGLGLAAIAVVLVSLG